MQECVRILQTLAFVEASNGINFSVSKVKKFLSSDIYPHATSDAEQMLISSVVLIASLRQKLRPRSALRGGFLPSWAGTFILMRSMGYWVSVPKVVLSCELKIYINTEDSLHITIHQFYCKKKKVNKVDFQKRNHMNLKLVSINCTYEYLFQFEFQV